MNDTPPEMTSRMRAMILKKKPEERLAMGCSMFDFSKRLVTSALLRERPQLLAAEMRLEIFLKFYGNDFDFRQKQKIMEHLKSQNRED